MEVPSIFCSRSLTKSETWVSKGMHPPTGRASLPREVPSGRASEGVRGLIGEHVGERVGPLPARSSLTTYSLGRDGLEGGFGERRLVFTVSIGCVPHHLGIDPPSPLQDYRQGGLGEGLLPPRREGSRIR